MSRLPEELAKRRAALEGAWRLGGAEAVKVLLRPGETERCPLCDRDGLVPILVRENEYHAHPRLSPSEVAAICPLCKGKRGIHRVQDLLVDELHSVALGRP